jgi:hypothetical protein
MRSATKARSRYGFGVTAVMVVPLASLTLTGGDGLVQVLMVVYGAIIGLSFRYPLVGLVFTLLTLLAQMSVHGDAIRSQWIDVRMLGAPVIAVMVVRALRESGSPSVEDDRRPLPAAPALLLMLRSTLPVVFLLGMTSVLWSINPTGTINRTVGLFAAAALSAAVARTVGITDLIRTLARLGWLVVAMCVSAWLVMPSVAIQQERLRGVFENANGLAAFLAVVSPVMLLRLRRLRWPAAAVLAVVCVSTGSRAGCIALGAVLLVFAVAARAAATRMLLLAVTGLAASWLLLQGLKGGFFVDPLIPLLRSTDSRSEAWAFGLAYFHANPALGVGMGSLPSGRIGGFVPESLATVGIVGTVILTFMLLTLVLLAARGQAMFMALVLGGLFSTFFEPWLFAGGSMVCVLFWVIALHPDSPGHSHDHDTGGSPATADQDRGASRRYTTVPAAAQPTA